MKRSSRDTDAADGTFVLERFLPFRFSVLSNRMTRAIGRITRRVGLSAPEWRAVAVLGRYGAVTANTVVERTAMDKVRVSRAVARLLKSGLITRRSDPSDRRRAILDLTVAGRSIFRQVAPLTLAAEAEMLADLSAEDRATLLRTFDKLEARVPPDPHPID